MEPLAASPVLTYAFVVLLQDEDDAQGLARLLEDLTVDSAGATATFVAPAVRGMAYLAGDDTAPWSADAPKGAEAILLIEHADGLGAQLSRLRQPARIYIGVPPDISPGQYRHLPNARAFTSDGPLDFAVQVLTDFSQPGAAGNGAIYDPAEADRMRALTHFTSNFEEEPSDWPAGPPGEAEFRSGASAYAAADYRTALKYFDDALRQGFADEADLHVWRGACLYEIARS